MDGSEMRTFQFREENGFLPDDVYVPTEEDDYFDPEQQEIRALVIEGYAANNKARREERMTQRIQSLESLLEEHGIPVPDAM